MSFSISSWQAYFADFGKFFQGFLFTLAISIGALTLALLLGIFFGAISTGKHKVLRSLARVFVEFYQNTPLLVQFVIVFYGLPLVSNYTIMPQAFRIILPPLINQIVNLIKNTSTVAIISGMDLMFVTKSWSALNSNYIPAFAGAALLYFLLCFPIASWGRRVEEANKQAYSI